MASAWRLSNRLRGNPKQLLTSHPQARSILLNEKGDGKEQPGLKRLDIYVFAHHPIADISADHRDPTQWQFYVTRTSELPVTRRLSLAQARQLGGVDKGGSQTGQYLIQGGFWGGYLDPGTDERRGMGLS